MDIKGDPYLEQVIEEVRAMREILQRDEERYNQGARIADDCFCPLCGARGHRTTCQNCEG